MLKNSIKNLKFSLARFLYFAVLIKIFIIYENVTILGFAIK